MIKFYTNLSPTTRLLIQSFLSVIGSVLAGVAAAAYQSYTQAGHLDLQALLNISLLTFALLFGKAMHDWVPAHAQQLIQATNDEKVALYNALQRQQNISQAVIATQGKQVQSTPSAQAQAQQQPVQPVQPIATSLNAGDIAAISQQLALNLMALSTPAQAATTATQVQQAPALPAVPVQNAYIDPLKVSAVLPAYRSPVGAISEQPTQKVALP